MRMHFAQVGLLLLVTVPSALAISVGGCVHVTDGAFGPGEWNCPTVVKSVFAPTASGAGGAALYVDQGQQGNNNLYLMYDYFAGGVMPPGSFFDVFFEVVPTDTDYLVRIGASGPTSLDAYERPLGTTAPTLPSGAFDVGPTSGWSPLLPGDPDLALAAFLGAVGVGPSVDNPTPHTMAEFQLTINVPGKSGLYDPSPAFWSASAKPNGALDPPISSAIFQLNPDGSTLVLPVLGPNGDPIMQGSAVPEPGTLLALVSGLALLAIRRKR
jgi:hypothetical protein